MAVNPVFNNTGKTKGNINTELCHWLLTCYFVSIEYFQNWCKLQSNSGKMCLIFTDFSSTEHGIEWNTEIGLENPFNFISRDKN